MYLTPFRKCCASNQRFGGLSTSQSELFCEPCCEPRYSRYVWMYLTFWISKRSVLVLLQLRKVRPLCGLKKAKKPGVHRIRCTSQYSFYTDSTRTSKKKTPSNNTQNATVSCFVIDHDFLHFFSVDLTDSCFVLWTRTVSLHSRLCAYGNKDLDFRFLAKTSPSRTGHLMVQDNKHDPLSLFCSIGAMQTYSTVEIHSS
jgi:hypothetical protein